MRQPTSREHVFVSTIPQASSTLWGKEGYVVNVLRSERSWPANVKHCPQSGTLEQTFLEKPLPVRYTCFKSCKLPSSSRERTNHWYCGRRTHEISARIFMVAPEVQGIDQGFTPVVDSAHLKIDRCCTGSHHGKQCIEAWQRNTTFTEKKALHLSRKKAERIESREENLVSSLGVFLPWYTRCAFDKGSSKLNTNGLNRFTGDQAQHHFSRDTSHF